MDASVNTETKGPDARAEALVASYERASYVRIAPAILQPAEPFLDLSGEDIRKRMYLTTAPGGGEFCLRPDLTIPVSRDYLASPLAGKPAGYCYLGPVFRDRGGGAITAITVIYAHFRFPAIERPRSASSGRCFAVVGASFSLGRVTVI